MVNECPVLTDEYISLTVCVCRDVVLYNKLSFIVAGKNSGAALSSVELIYSKTFENLIDFKVAIYFSSKILWNASEIWLKSNRFVGMMQLQSL